MHAEVSAAGAEAWRPGAVLRRPLWWGVLRRLRMRMRMHLLRLLLLLLRRRRQWLLLLLRWLLLLLLLGLRLCRCLLANLGALMHERVRRHAKALRVQQCKA